MKLDFKRAIEGPWQEQNRDKLLKLAAIIFIAFGPMVIGMYMNGQSLGNPYMYDQYGASMTTPTLSPFFTVIMLYTSIVMIPFMLYMYGYQINTFRNFLNNNFDLPEVDMSHFRAGVRVLGFGLLLGLIIMGILGIIALLGGVLGMFGGFLSNVGTAGSGAVRGVILGITLIVGLIAFYIFIGLYSASSYYMLAKTDKVTESLSLAKSYHFIKRYWKRLLLAGLVYIGISIVTSLAIQTLVLVPYIGWILYITFIAYYAFSMLYIFADMFRDLEIPGRKGYSKVQPTAISENKSKQKSKK